ncbi:hypothetical protein DFP92_13110 [Yoonia sediminilitoris]|uniref:Uncharacterized protein n=1 Tax=Yoonia sediminilitoris TaxID=1286148 RepID=A0A2T6K4A5_9RHOB|nr:hypothetical protein C8N45_13110 [Yoonia sediminilitoris]RCW89478.1 hypothetical protein DFP92_13110 [Yoonia sediminilitoris]
MRTLPPLPCRVFADAASARDCGVVFAVKQHVSPNRPLKVSPRGRIQSTCSPQRGSTNEERDFADILTSANAGPSQPDQKSFRDFRQSQQWAHSD